MLSIENLEKIINRCTRVSIEKEYKFKWEVIAGMVNCYFNWDNGVSIEKLKFIEGLCEELNGKFNSVSENFGTISLER